MAKYITFTILFMACCLKASAGTVIGGPNNSVGSMMPSNLPTDIISVAAGSGYALALTSNGQVWGWGYKAQQSSLGDAPSMGGNKIGGRINHPNATGPTLDNIVAISACASHSMALKKDGTVIEWGQGNDPCAYGNPNPTSIIFTSTTVPVPLQSANNHVIAIAAGANHSLALFDNGAVWGWGINNRLQIGNIEPGHSGTVSGGEIISVNPNSTDPTHPTSPVTLNNAIKIAASLNQSVAVLGDGTILHWGVADWAMTGSSSAPTGGNMSNVAAGPYHVLATHNDGTIQAWQIANQDCHGGINSGQSDPPSINAINSGVIAGLYKITAVSASDYYSLVLRDDGKVMGWGNGFVASNSNLKNVVSSWSSVVGVAAGGDFVIGVKGTLTPCTAPSIIIQPMSQLAGVGGTFTTLSVAATGMTLNYQWKRNGVQISGATSPTLSLSPVTTLSAGNYTVTISNSCGSVTSLPAVITVIASHLPSGGNVIGWGNNSCGQIGDALMPTNNNQIKTIPDPANPQNMITLKNKDIVAVAAGRFHSLALTAEGEVIGWGAKATSTLAIDYGQIKIPPNAKQGVIAIAAGFYYSMALKSDGTVIAWGYNDYGETDVDSVYGLNNIVAIAAGAFHCLALRSDNTVFGWGHNVYSQLNSTGSARYFGRVTGLGTNITTIAAGGYHSLGLSNGIVNGIGYSHMGQLSFPSDLYLNGANVIGVAAGDWHSVMLKSDGTVEDCGGNINLPPPIDQAATHPELNGTLGMKVTAISAGGEHSLAIINNVVFAWGAGKTGQNNLNDPPAGWGGEFDFGQSAVPGAATSKVLAISAGGYHSLAIVIP